MANDNIIELYKIYKSYLDQENTLTSSRSTWCITIQAFLLGSFGLLANKYYELMINGIERNDALFNLIMLNYGILLLTISLLGMVVSVYSSISTKAASKAMENIESTWKNWHKSDADEAGLPNITGGGVINAGKNGGKFARSIPQLMFIFWFVVAMLIGASLGYYIYIFPQFTNFFNW